MSVVFDPDRILEKVLPKKADDLLTSDLKFRDKFKQNLLRLDFLTKGDINKGIAKSLQFYNRKIKDLKAQGESAAEAKAQAINGGALLKARLSDLVVEKASEDIKEKFAGKQYIWLPSSAEDPDPVHALNYGKTFIVGEGEQPGERYGCRCGMEFLGVSHTDPDIPDIMKVNPGKVKQQLETGKARAQEAAKARVADIEARIKEADAKIKDIEAREAQVKQAEAQKAIDFETKTYDLYDKVLKDNKIDAIEPIKYRVIDKSESKKLMIDLKIQKDLTGYTHEINSEIYHFITGIRANGKAGHGDAIFESKIGQIAVQKKDLLLIPEITKNYDSVSIKTRGGMKLRYVKKIKEKTYYYSESVSNPKSKVLRPKTMFIKK
ncbi:MAG: hypothetical protein LBV16_09300 [Elusimicrobiota bacterium]|jgi:hypothetical protein|nr:hypothetical protein [Elusimicrobiota bacterium]